MIKEITKLLIRNGSETRAGVNRLSWDVNLVFHFLDIWRIAVPLLQSGFNFLMLTHLNPLARVLLDWDYRARRVF
jgi:hypothetical protein